MTLQNPGLLTNDDDDMICREIEDGCLFVWEELCRLSEKIDEPPALNSAIVFFYPLQFILSAWVFRMNEFKRGVERQDACADKRNMFPFIDASDVRGAIDAEDKLPGFLLPGEREIYHQRKSRTKRLALAARFAARRDARRVGLLCPTLPLRELTGALARRGLAASIVDSCGFPFRNAAMQWPTIQAGIMEILHNLGSSHEQRASLASVIRRSVEYHCEDDPREFNCDGLLVGTMPNTLQRTSAAQAARQGLKVVSVMHGDSHGVHDEPYFAYAEHSLSTAVLGYGKGAIKSIREGKYLQPPLQDFPFLITSDSPFVRSIYEPANKIMSWPTEPDAKLLYVPTSLSGDESYGPFRSMPDVIYIRWQERILRDFPNAILKTHPGETVSREVPVIDEARLFRGDLKSAANQFDGFIFDYVSTGFSRIAATAKPILLFDTGVRRLSNDARRAINSRCVCVPISLSNTENLRETAIQAASGRHFINTFTPEFSLDDLHQSRCDSVAEWFRNEL